LIGIDDLYRFLYCLAVLAADTKIYLLATYRIASEPIYPFDYRETVKESIEIVDSYQEKAGRLFDLTPTLTALRHLLKSVEELYASLRVGRMSRRRAEQFNRVLKRIARTLIPLSYTRAGEFGHDPALEVKAYPALAEVLGLSGLERDETRLRFAQTQLTREQNRIVQKLNDLRRDVEDSVKRLKATR
jgi:N-acetylated-alpha-linked acidic dipeptidase